MSKLNLGDSLILNTDITVGGEEVKTGATFNGKPVYAKVVKCTYSSTADANSDTPHGITNLGLILSYINMGVDNASWHYPLNYATPYTYSICYTDNIRIRISTNNSGILGKSVDIGMFYTKTTD